MEVGEEFGGAFDGEFEGVVWGGCVDLYEFGEAEGGVVVEADGDCGFYGFAGLGVQGALPEVEDFFGDWGKSLSVGCEL